MANENIKLQMESATDLGIFVSGVKPGVGSAMGGGREVVGSKGSAKLLGLVEEMSRSCE